MTLSPLRFSLGLSAFIVARPAHAELDEAWQALARFDSVQATTVIESLPGEARLTREAAYAEAVVLLATEPQTQHKIERVQQLLTAIIEDQATDEFEAKSRYLMGRIFQIHQRDPDPALARQWYESLVRERPRSVAAQQAALQLVLLDIYEDASGSNPTETIARAMRWAVVVTEPNIRRDVDLAIARSCLFFNISPAQAYEALQAVIAAPVAGGLRQRADNYVSAILLAEELGKPGEAVDFLRRFLREFPRDSRRTALQLMLERLERN